MLKTHFKLVKRDESEYWREDIIAKAGKIQTVFIYDELRSVNLCELEPSYELTPLYYVTDNHLSDDDNEMLLYALTNESVAYVHCRSQDRVVCDFDCGEETHDADNDDEGYENVLNKRIEYEKCNIRFF